MDAYEHNQADKQMAERLIPRPGHVVEMTSIPACDICGRPATWDAPTKDGPWAWLCDTHERRLHVYPGRTGMGIGQRLIPRVPHDSSKSDIIVGREENPL